MKTSISLKSFIEKSNIPAQLIRAVVLQFGGYDSFVDSAFDVSNHGIDGGFSGFIYYSETEDFARKNLESIMELMSSEAQEFGYDSTFAMIRGFNCLRDDKITDMEIFNAICKGKNPVDGPNLLNALAWYAGEEVCRAYTDLMENN